jgi:hypothetical protein
MKYAKLKAPLLWLLAIVFSGAGLFAADGVVAAPVAEPANAAKVEKPVATEKADKSEKAEKAEKAAKKKKAIKLAEDAEDPPPKEKDAATYELSNKRMLDDYLGQDLRPFDRGEHMLISALVGGIGGSVVGGLVGFSMFDKNNETQSLNYLYTFGGAGAGAGAVVGIAVTFFETGKIAQFAIGKFLMRYSWYGAIGGGLLGAGVGFIPYSSSNDYSDIFRYGGYGAGIGLVAGLTLFFFDLPEHLKLYSYRQADQNMIALTLAF